MLALFGVPVGVLSTASEHLACPIVDLCGLLSVTGSTIDISPSVRVFSPSAAWLITENSIDFSIESGTRIVKFCEHFYMLNHALSLFQGFHMKFASRNEIHNNDVCVKRKILHRKCAKYLECFTAKFLTVGHFQILTQNSF